MDNYLESGGVLPSGLLTGNDYSEKIAGFNKTYKNYPLRVGIIDKIYAYTDPNNFTKLSTEYDVLVFEQNEDRGSTIITYKNCIANDGLGSIADFFEKNFRPKTINTNPNGILNSTYQNGAIVILLCLDGVSEKGVIIGGITHPDRQTTLIDTQPRLTGEYNGVNIAVNPDGSTILTFQGATDSYGEPTNPAQGNTTVQITNDGTFQVQNSETTLRMDKTAKEVTISSTGNWTVNIQGNTNINTTGNTTIATTGDTNINSQGVVNVIAQGIATIDGSKVELGVDAAEAVIKGDTFKNLYNNHVHLGNLGVDTGPPLAPMDPSLSTHVFTK